MNTNTRRLAIFAAAHGALFSFTTVHGADYAVAAAGVPGQSVNAAIGGGRLINKWSFCAWVFITEGGSYTAPDSPVALLTSQESPPSGISAEILLTDNAGTQRLELGRSNYYFGTQSTGKVPLHQWTHVAVTVSSSNVVRYYINGAAAGVVATDYAGRDTTIGGTAASGAGLVRFMGNGAARKFKGRMDDVQIWSTELTLAEIQGYMMVPPAGNESALAAWYRLDEGGGTVTGNSDTGAPVAPLASLTGGVTWVPGASTRFTVTNTADTGEGSLRQALEYAALTPGPNTLTFAPALSGQVIVPGSALAVTGTENVTIDATALPVRPVIERGSGPGFYPVLVTDPAASVTLRGLGFMDLSPANTANLILNRGTMTMTRCVLEGGPFGGPTLPRGVYNSGLMALTACSINYFYGGAIANHGPLTLTACYFGGNYSDGSGGAIDNTSTLTLTNCTLQYNHAAAGWGGAILHAAGTLTLTHCSLTGNSAAYDGGAIWGAGAITLTNSIVAENTATAGTGADIYNTGTFTRTGANIVQSFVNGAGGTATGPAAINAAPLLSLGQQYGGPTATMMPLQGSPAVDAVPDSAIVPGLLTDQRGFLRNRDGDTTPGARPDIGACEVQTPLAFGAERIVVTTTADENDETGTLGTGISLREAVRDTAWGRGIGFDIGIFSSGPPVIVLDAAKGQMVLTKDVTIDATGTRFVVTLDAGPGFNRIFSVPESRTVFLSGLALAGRHTDYGFGGAIFNEGYLTLTTCSFYGHSSGNYGGAIFNTATGNLDLTQCALSGNSANVSGGAVMNQGILALTNCTLSGNSASYGGAIHSQSPASLTHCTVSGNSATVGGGGIYNINPGALTLTNSIVAGNTAPAAQGGDIFNTLTVTRAGANIVQTLTNSSGGVDTGPPALGTAPLLGPLADNGGPTLTMAPLSGSPAVDAVPAASILAGLATDQRGFPRNREGDTTAGARPDIGACEAQTPPASGPERIVVTTTADENDLTGTPGTGVSLREAVRDAAPGRNITFDPVVFSAAAHTIVLDAAKGEIILTKNAVIDGGTAPSGVTVDGGPGANRIFNVYPGPAVSVFDLTFTGGAQGGGGAIYNQGTLALTRCTLTGNVASNGGAISNQNSLALIRCTLSGNSAVASHGGAIVNANTLTMIQCTLSGNSATGDGGAIYSVGGTAVLTHCTLSGNTAGLYGGGVYQFTAGLTLTNCIVAGNLAPAGQGADVFNESGTLTRAGANILQTLHSFGGTAGGPAAISAPALLAPLANYGGPTSTMALRPGSPARNAAAGSAAVADQRDFPIVGTADIGAYEAGTFLNCPAYIAENLPATATAAQSAPGADFDSDGATNADEWFSLTDPASPFSVFRITAVVRSGGTTVLTFPSVTGRKYTLWRSDTLAGAWINTGLPIITGNGTNQTFTIPATVPGIPRRFYRVETGL